jgi:osmotically inducible protein OsmC
MEREATAQCRGNPQEGIGFVRTESGSIKNAPYSFAKRFGSESGINPEELIAAAHSSCFTMAMAAELDKKKMKAETIDVRSSVSIEQSGEGWLVSRVHLSVSVFVPQGEKADIYLAAVTAKDHCPISKLLNVKITMDFHHVDHQGIELH